MVGEDETGMAWVLAAVLSLAGLEAESSGAGVHRHVDVGPVAERSLRIHCFWCECAIGSALCLNAVNSRSRLQPPGRAPYEGPEYFVVLKESNSMRASGRSRDIKSVVACAQHWLAQRPLEQLEIETPFIDEIGRAMRAFAARLDPSLSYRLGGDPSYELTIRAKDPAKDRTCTVRRIEDTNWFAFLIGDAQLACGRALDETAVSAWLIDRLSVREFGSFAPGIELESHAEVLEIDAARWHWLHLRDRIADPQDVLAPMRELVERLATSPIVNRYFSFSSLNRLCFSASSHYPWVNKDLPVVYRAEDGTYFVGKDPCDLSEAAKLIELKLASSPLEPFFGSGAV